MAFALPASASAIAAAAPTVAATAAKATLMTTLKTVAFNALTNLAISAALSAFQPVVGQSGRTFEFVIDPDGPIPFAAGRVGVAGSVIHRDTFGPDLMFYGIPAVLSGAGPITAIDSVMADDYPMSFDSNGGATTEPYRQELYFRSVLGAQPAAVALSTPSGLKKNATLPGWTAQHKLSGKAAFLMVMAENSKGSAFPTGEVKPLITLRGLKVYDPRQDSSYPGGSGPQRLNDPSTWTYSANPLLWALKWCLGLWEGPNGKGAPQVDFQVGGIGAKPSGIDFPAFIAAANIADANGWTVSAYPNTDDDKSQVLDAFLQAGGCIYAQRAGKMSCIQRAAPRASVVTISVQDTAGPLEIDTAASRIDRINTLRPRFWSEPHRWQMTALTGEVTAQAYRDEDGAVRSRGLDYPYVSNAKQCGQLAALQIANTREGIAGVIPLKPHLQRIRPGDAFTITEAGFVLNGLKCLCLNTDYDPATGIVRVSFVSETDAKYPFALGQNPTPPTPQVLTPVDPRFVSPPEPGDWTITPRPPAPGGGQLPGFDLSGIVSNETATAIIVEYGPTATGPWKQAYQGPPTVTNIPIDGLQPGGTYYIAVQYQREQNFSERYVYGPYVAPALIGDVDPNAPGLSNIYDQITLAFGDIFDVSELLGDARDLIDAQGVEIATARGGQPNLNSRIVQVNQARIDGDTSNAEAISLVQARTANTEADIIDLENALATEAGARAEAIQQVTARQNINPNLFPGGSGELGVAGWGGSGGLLVGNYPNVGPSYFFKAFPVGVAVDDYQVSPRFSVEGIPTITAQWTGYAYLGAATEVWVAWYDAGGAYVSETPHVSLSSGSPQTFARPSTAIFAEWVLRTYGPAPMGYADVVFHQIKFERGSVATIYSNDASQKAIGASVTEQFLAIIDLENQQAIAAYEVLANASGGLPAFLRLISSSAGGYAALVAPVVALMNSVPGGDPLVALQAIGGEVFFPRPIYVDLGGRRLIMGPGNGWVLWFGPDTISAAGATRTNGIFCLGTDGKVYYGTNELAGGAKSGGRTFQSGAGGSAAETVIDGVAAGSFIEMTGNISGGSLSTDAPLYGTMTLSEVNAAGSRQVYAQAVTVESDGVQNPNGSYRAMEAGASSIRVPVTKTGSVTYRVDFARTGGSRYVNGAILSGSVFITPPA